MKIKILGTRGQIKPSKPYHSKHSGILIDNKLLFDVREKEYLKEKPSFIFITHLHPDHAFFVSSDEKIDIKVPIYAPEKNSKAKINLLTKKQNFSSYSIKPIPTIHSLKVKSQAYLIENKNKKILYTGDMIWIEKKYHKYLKNLDLVICEGSFLRKGGRTSKDKKTGKLFGHNGIPDFIHLFKPFTNTILFTHFGSWFYDDVKESRKKLQKLAKENGIKIIAGYDGLTINI